MEFTGYREQLLPVFFRFGIRERRQFTTFLLANDTKASLFCSDGEHKKNLSMPDERFVQGDVNGIQRAIHGS